MTYTIEQPPPLVYALCCTSRSGSTYLCELLASTGVLGRPGEYLNTASMTRWRTELDLPSDATDVQYMNCLLETCTVGDCFGVKTVPEALTRLEAHVEPTHFIWLRRRDTLRQAISLYRASHSGVWQSRDDHTPRTNVPFDRQAIEQVRTWIDSTNEHWQARFAEERRPVLPVWYDAVCQQPQETVASIGRFLERPLPEGLVVQATTRQMRDAMTQQWAQRLVA